MAASGLQSPNTDRAGLPRPAFLTNNGSSSPGLGPFLFGMVACEGSAIARQFLPEGDRYSQRRVGRNDGRSLRFFMWAGLHNLNETKESL